MVNRLQRIQDSKEAEALLLLLDLKFIASSRRVLEVALGEFKPGKVLFDDRVENQCTTEELLTKPDGPLYQIHRVELGLRLGISIWIGTKSRAYFPSLYPRNRYLIGECFNSDSHYRFEYA